MVLETSKTENIVFFLEAKYRDIFDIRYIDPALAVTRVIFLRYPPSHFWYAFLFLIKNHPRQIVTFAAALEASATDAA